MENLNDIRCNQALNNPIFLIDCSGSTQTKIGSKLVNIDKIQNVFWKEIDVTIDMMNNHKVSHARILLWSDKEYDLGEVSISEIVAKIDSSGINMGGTTLLANPLTKVMEILKSTEDKKRSDVIIITDGEINDAKTVKPLLKQIMETYSVRMGIVTVEPNNTDYYLVDCLSGNNLTKVLRESNLFNDVSFIHMYNNIYSTYSNKYVNFDNPELPNGYISYMNKAFHINNIQHFIQCFINQTKEDDSFTINNVYHLVRVINSLEKEYEKINKPFKKRVFVDFACNVIDNYEMEQTIRLMLIHGNANMSYQEFRTIRKNLFNQTHTQLYEGTQSAIFSGSNLYATIPFNNKIYYGRTSKLEDLTIGYRKYKRSGLAISADTKLPVIPSNPSRSLKKKQEINQWMRTIYSDLYKLPADADLLHWIILMDNLHVQLSNVCEDVKSIYRSMAYIMLHRINRLDEKGGQIEYDFLMKGNKPVKVGFVKESVEEMIKMCPNNTFTYLDPMTIWHLMTKAVDENLYHIQLENSPINVNLNVNELWNSLKSSDLIDEKLNIPDNQNYEYYCYLILEETNETGGWTFYPHQNSCQPNYVLSNIARETYMNTPSLTFTCPHCRQVLDWNLMIKVDVDISDTNNTNNTDNISNVIKASNIIDVVDVNPIGLKLIKMEDTCLSKRGYNHINFKDTLVIANNMNTFHSITSVDEFKKSVPSFLKDIDMTNVVVAGGMCRSILLGQPINDIDMFIVDIDNLDEYKKRVYKLLEDLVSTIKSQDQSMKFICMYKPQFSVIELMCIKANTGQEIYTIEAGSDKEVFANNYVVHKIQIVCMRYGSIDAIMSGFDLVPSCVVYDGKDVWFTEQSELAYRHMINVIDITKYTSNFDFRILKYYEYGFAIAVPKNVFKFDQNISSKLMRSIKVNELEFKIVNSLDNNIILCDGVSLNETRPASNRGNSGNTGMYKSTPNTGMYKSTPNTGMYKSTPNTGMYKSYSTSVNLKPDMVAHRKNLMNIYHFITENKIEYHVFENVADIQTFSSLDDDNESTESDVGEMINGIQMAEQHRIQYNWYENASIDYKTDYAY